MLVVKRHGKACRGECFAEALQRPLPEIRLVSGSRQSSASDGIHEM